MSVEADDDGVNVPEVSTDLSANGELGKGPSGSKPWHVWTEANLNSGEPTGSRKGMGIQLTEGCPDDRWAVRFVNSTRRR